MTDEQKPVCDVRIGWVLAGCCDRWRDEVKLAEVGIGPVEIAARVGTMAGSLALEQWAAEMFRAKRAFNLKE